MKHDKFTRLVAEQKAALHLLREQQLVTPFLMVLYATIDVLAYASGGGSDKQSGERFRQFATTYLLPYLADITAYDLWGARCAILHTASPESTASVRGRARQILYSWGIGRIETLKEVIAGCPRPDQYVAISLEDLESGVSHALRDLVTHKGRDSGLRDRLEKSIAKFYSTINLRKEGE